MLCDLAKKTCEWEDGNDIQKSTKYHRFRLIYCTCNISRCNDGVQTEKKYILVNAIGLVPTQISTV